MQFPSNNISDVGDGLQRNIGRMLKKSLPGTVKRRTTEYSLLPKRFTFNDSRLTGGFDAIGGWTGLDLALGHDGGRATSFAAFVYLAIHDLHAL